MLSRGGRLDRFLRRGYSALFRSRSFPISPRLRVVPNGSGLGLPGLYDEHVGLGKLHPRWGDLANESALIFLCLLLRSGLDPVFEFGTYRGRTTYNLALNAPQGKSVYTIDIGVGSDADANVEGRDYEKYSVGEVFLRADSAVRERIESIVGDSRSVDLSHLYGAMGLVVVDGGHSYDVCMHDSQVALSLVRPGGVVVWDDYSPYWPGVRDCIDELAERLDLVFLEREQLVVLLAKELRP